ncbi:MAG: hypothetical protein WCT16_00215 [Candidatus Buchananbacteria bacterium]
MIKSESLQQLTESRNFFEKKIEKWTLSQLLFILAIAELLALLLKVQALMKKSRHKLVFTWHEDYECHYGEHSSGPSYEIKNDGKKKLVDLGLSEEEIRLLFYARYYDYYDRFDQQPLKWIIEPEEGARKRDIDDAIVLVKNNLECAVEEWNRSLKESPRLKPSAEFLISFLPEPLVKEIFADVS